MGKFHKKQGIQPRRPLARNREKNVVCRLSREERPRMQRPTQADEMQRELHATLSAMREVGPAYEDHLVESFVQKFTQQVIVQLKDQAKPEPGPSAGQRLALAIVSLCLLFPMSIAIISVLANGSGFGGYDGLVAAMIALGLLCLTVLGVNFFFNRRH